MRRTTSVVLSAMLLVACSAPQYPGGGSMTPSESSASTAPATASLPFVRTCDTSVYGELGAGWKQDALTIGAVSFIGLGDAEASTQDETWTHDDPWVGPSVTVTIAPESEVALHTVSIQRLDTDDAGISIDAIELSEFPSDQLSWFIHRWGTTFEEGLGSGPLYDAI